MRSFPMRFSYLVLGSLILSVFVSLPLRATPIFVVEGSVTKADGTAASGGLDVTVENTTAKTRLGRDVVGTEKTTPTGTYSVFLPTDFVSDIALVNDVLTITVEEGANVVGQTTYTVTEADITNAKATVNVKLLGVTIALDRSVLIGDGVSTATVTFTVVDKSGAPVTNDTIRATASLGTLSEFVHTGNGVYRATYTSASVTKSTPVTLTVTSGTLNLSVTANLSLVVATGETGEEGVRGSILAVTGTVTYEDGTTFVPLAEGLTVDVLLNGQVQSATVGDAGDGKFSVVFLSPLGVVVTSGDIVTVQVKRGGSVLAEKSLIVSSDAVRSAELSVGTVNSNLKQPEATSQVLAVSGTVTYRDGTTPLSESENVVVEVTIRDRTEIQTVGTAGPGKFSLVFFNALAPVVGTGDLVVIRLKKNGQEVGSTTILASSNDVKAGVLDAKEITTTLSPSTSTLTVTGTVLAEDGANLAPAGTSIRVTNLSRPDVPPQTGTVGSAGAGKFSVVFFAPIGDLVAVTGDEILLEAFTPGGASLGRMKFTLMASHILSATAHVEFRLAGEFVVGGLAIDLPNYIRLLQQTLNTATDVPDVEAETRAIIKTLLPQLIRSGTLTGIAIPIFPASLEEKPTQPVLVPDPTGLDLENFGNPLFISLLDATAENPLGLLDGSFRVPVALVGNKMSLYVRGGAEGSTVQVQLKRADGTIIPLRVEDVSETGTFEYTFTMDEELALLMLPAWPGSTLNPVESVTLYLAEGNKEGPYRAVPMSQTLLTNGQVRRGWTTTETLKAGTTYYYYYRIRLTNPIPVSTVPEAFTREWAIPDVRNLQFEDRGFPNSADPELRRPLLDALAMRVQPILGNLIQSIEATAVQIAQEAILKDPALQAEIANDPEIRAILLDKVLSDPAIQARILDNSAALAVFQNRLRTDGAIQAQLANDPTIQQALLANPTVQARQEAITGQVITELSSDPRVVAAAEAAAEAAARAVLQTGGTPAQAEAAGETAGRAAAEAKIRELAPAMVEARLRAELPSLLADPSVAGAILPLAAPKILPVVASDLVPIVGPDILPLVQADIQPIIIAKYGSRFLNQALAAVVGDPTALVNRVTSELLPYVQKVGAEIAATLEVPLVSKFTVPAKSTLRIVTAEMATIPDGIYTVEVVDETGSVRIAKPLTIDRSPGTVENLEIVPNAGAGAYVRETDGVLVAAQLDPSGTLDLGATIKGDAVGALFQIIGIEDDPAKQAERIWVPVNQASVLLAAGLVTAEQVKRDDLYDTALLALVLTDPASMEKLRTLDPKAVGTFLKGYEALSPEKKAEVQLLAALVRQAFVEGNFAAVSSLLSLNFATLQEYALLLANLRSGAPFIGGPRGSIRMFFPSVGKYGVRAVAVDQYGNISTYQAPKRLDIVPAEADKFAITHLSAGDQNGDGNETGAFESVDVGPDGVVDPEKFRIFSNFTSLRITYVNTKRTEHPLVKVALQFSSDGQTWTDIGALSASELVTVKEGDTFSVDYTFDAKAWAEADVKQVMFRVVAENKLTVIDTSPVTALQVDPNPLAIEPKILSFTVQRAPDSTPNPDSGGERGVQNLTATTSSFTNPTLQGVRFEYSDDGGTTWKPLDAAAGGENNGLVTTSTPVENSPTVTWLLAWDTTKLPDSVTNKEPEARDATKDDNPYLLRAIPVDVANKDYAPSDVISLSTDNVDDVPPLSGTKITLVERQARNLVDYESALAADGKSWIVRAQVRLTVQVAASPTTFVGGKVSLVTVDATGNVTGTVAELDAQETTDYEFVLDTRAFPNGTYQVTALVSDAAGNQEEVLLENVQTVEVKNITVVGLSPEDPRIFENILITETGAFKGLKRALSQAAAERPVSGRAVVTLESVEAESAAFVVASDPAFLSEEALRLLEPSESSVSEEKIVVAGVRDGNVWTFTLDTLQIEDGEVSARIVLGGSPNVFSPIVGLTVDNTPPDLSFLAPVAGSTVGTRPHIWAEYQDASGVVQLSFSLDTLTRNLVKESFGDPDTLLATTEKSGIAVTGNRVVYSPPNVTSRLSAGPHTTSVSVFDRAGNETTAQIPFVVEMDTTAPSILSFIPTGTLTHPRPSIAVTFTDIVSGVTDAGVRITVSGVEGTTKLTHADGTDAQAGEVVLSGTATFIPNVDLKPGEYTVTAVVTDGDGNSAPVTWSFTVVADTAKPIVTAYSPVGTVTSAEAWIVVSFTDESAVTANVRLDNAAAVAMEVADTRARYRVTGLAGGAHTVVVSLKDARGNESVVEWSFTVTLPPEVKDTAKPVILAYSPLGTVTSAETWVVVSFTDESAVTATVRLDSASAVAMEVVDTRARYKLTGLSQGLHTLIVAIKDAPGNETVIQWDFTVEIDKVAPVISAFTPTGYVGTNKPTLLVAYNDSGVGVDVNSLVFTLDGKAVEPTTKDTARVSYTPRDTLASGVHTVYVEVADILSNKASVNWTFIVETTPPSITSVVPAPGSKVRGDEETRSNVLVTAFYSDSQSGIAKETAKITVTSQGTTLEGTTTAETSAITWRAASPLKAGVYRASVEVADAVGNKASYSWLFMIEEETVLTSAPMRIVPNPSEGEAALWFGLGQEADVSVRIFDFNQRLVAERGAEYLTPGLAKVALGSQLADLARGIYLVQVIIEPRFAGERVVKLLKLAKVR